MGDRATPSDVARVLEFDREATVGPWLNSIRDGEHWVKSAAQTMLGYNYQLEARVFSVHIEADRALIAEYRTLAPNLARELERAWEALRKAKAKILDLRHSVTDWEDDDDQIITTINDALPEENE